MKKRKSVSTIKNLSKYNIICVVLIFIALGFAALGVTLGITGFTRIGKIVFDIHFENVVESYGSIEALTPATIRENDKTNIDFELKFTEPGQFYEFEVDVVNDGTLDAYLTNFDVMGIDDDIKKYFNFSYTYAEGSEIKKNDLLKAGDMDIIKVRIELKYDITFDDLPNITHPNNFSFKTTYKQDNGDGVEKNNYLYDKLLASYTMMDEGIDIFDYEYNGSGLFLNSSTISDTYPMVYYHGGIDTDDDGIEDSLNNNILFAGYCWKILRTTEQGGTKLVYNGEPKMDFDGEVLKESDYIFEENNDEYSFSYAYDNPFGMPMAIFGRTDESTGVIELKVKEAGRYAISYNLFIESGNFLANIYINGSQLSNDVTSNNYYGFELLTMELGYVTKDDVIKIEYYNNGDESIEMVGGIAFSFTKINSVFGLSCRNSGYATQITSEGQYDNLNLDNFNAIATYERGEEDEKSIFNFDSYSLASVGYMYGDDNYNKVQWEDTEYIYASDVKYEGESYSLIDPTESPNKISDYPEKHYTCKMDELGVCSTVYFVYYAYRNSKWDSQTSKYVYSYDVYALEFENGKTIDDFYKEVYRNKYDSNVKKTIDTWFKENLTAEVYSENKDYQEYLEDAIWCNNRTITDGGFLKNNDMRYQTVFQGALCYIMVAPPSVEKFQITGVEDNETAAPVYDTSMIGFCPNKNDRFTKNDIINGNGALTYSVGLLTLDEMALAGTVYRYHEPSSASYEVSRRPGDRFSYLYTGNSYWSMTPLFGMTKWDGFRLAAFMYSGELDPKEASDTAGVRPAIVLKHDVKLKRGDGSLTNPYEIKY